MNLKRLKAICIKNAKELLFDSNILWEKKRYSRCAFLAICAVEEAIKCSLVSLLETGVISFTDFNKYFRSHPKKFLYHDANVLIEWTDADEKVSLKPLVTKKPEYVTRMIELRENSLYVDYSKGKITSPSTIGKKDAMKYMELARNGIRDELVIELLVKKLHESRR